MFFVIVIPGISKRIKGGLVLHPPRQTDMARLTKWDMFALAHRCVMKCGYCTNLDYGAYGTPATSGYHYRSMMSDAGIGCAAYRKEYSAVRQEMKTEKSKLQKRNSYWSLTLFQNEWKDFQHEDWKLEGQLEKCPETGKLHYQGMLHTGQVRFSAVKKVFPFAHIEEARDPEALKKYVHKKETRVEPRVSSQKMNRDKFFNDVFEYAETETFAEELKHDRNCVLLNDVVERMINAGGDWAYSYMAINPQTKQLWARFRLVYYTSWKSDRQANVAIEYTDDNADDDTLSWKEDTGDEQAVTVECASEAEDDSEAEGTEANDSDGEDDSVSSSED